MADSLGVHPQTIRVWIREKGLPVFQAGRRGHFRFSIPDVWKWYENYGDEKEKKDGCNDET